MKKPITHFTVSLDPSLQEISPTISQGRVRIFYTGANRNLTYISEEFANKLLETLPYTPVGGVWVEEKSDFSGHLPEEDGTGFSALGVVPQNCNLQWETVLDSDGIERIYASCDVYLWTAKFETARKVSKKCQSMELYIDSVSGDWIVDEDGVERYHYSNGSLLALVALGEDVEPCFQGAAFYNKIENFTEQLSKIIYESKILLNELRGDEQNKMSEKVDEIQETEEMDNEQSTGENEEITIEFSAKVVVENSSEESSEEPVEEINEEISEGNNEEQTSVNVPFNAADGENSNEFSENAEVIEGDDVSEENDDGEPQVSFESLTQEIATLKNTISAQSAQIETFNQKINEYLAIINSYQVAEKQEMINKYSAKLGAVKTQEFLEKLDKFSLAELKQNIALQLIDLISEKENISLESYSVSDENAPVSGAEKLVLKHRNKKNKK